MRSLKRLWLILAPVSSLPTASAAFRGQLRIVAGNGSTTNDELWLCRLTSAGGYAWVQIT